MAVDFNTLYSNLLTVYKKDTDQDFPINKIRFFMDFLWNSVVGKELTEEQKAALKQLIDLLNSLDDHKLSESREMIQALTPQLAPLMATYPSLGHSFSLIFTTVIPSYQRYLSSLELQVKDAHPFTRDEVLLYYDMTLVDHIVLSHIFEREENVNLIEVIESIKAIIVVNALTHDYLQDTLARSISLFTFLQRGGLAKDQCFDFYAETVTQIVTTLKEQVSSESCKAAVEFLTSKLVALATQANQSVSSEASTETQALDTLMQDASVPVTPTAPPTDAPVGEQLTSVTPPVSQSQGAPAQPLSGDVLPEQPTN